MLSRTFYYDHCKCVICMLPCVYPRDEQINLTEPLLLFYRIDVETERVLERQGGEKEGGCLLLLQCKSKAVSLGLPGPTWLSERASQSWTVGEIKMPRLQSQTESGKQRGKTSSMYPFGPWVQSFGVGFWFHKIKAPFVLQLGFMGFPLVFIACLLPLTRDVVHY